MNLKKFAIYTLLYFSIGACNKQEIDLDAQNNLVINSLFSTDSSFGVYLSNSYNITDTIDLLTYIPPQNVLVTVFENDILIDTLNQLNLYTIYLQNYLSIPITHKSDKLKPKPGNTYKIKVEQPGKLPTYAIATIPLIVPILKTDTLKLYKQNTEPYGSNIIYQFTINFTDPVNTNNYYMIFVYNKEDEYASNLLGYRVNFYAPFIEQELMHGSEQFGVAFTDRSFNGLEQSLKITIPGEVIGYPVYDNGSPFHHNQSIIYIRLYSITPEFYNYIETVNLFFKNYKNPLAEPTQIYSNIINGFGIFSGAAVYSDSIVFK